MTELQIEFTGRPGDANDTLAHDVVARHGGTVIGAGTLIPDGLRDIQATFDEAAQAAACRKEFAQYPAFHVTLDD